VEQGMPYFYRFLDKYPDVNSFAAAAEDEILKLWQGLGYYSRGRNMLKTARMVRELHGGVFPTAYTELLKLKGIGEYTAAAISSFSADEPRAVIDGNVYRVLARYFGIEEPINSPKGQKIFRRLADELLNHDHPGMHNQAMMELGAIVCKPKSPLCSVCPVSTGCAARLNGTISKLPVKLNTVKIRERFFNYFLVTDGNGVLMNKRDDSDIWANMYDLPLIETPGMTETGHLLALPQVKEYFGDDIKIEGTPATKKHILTHQRLFVRMIKLGSNSVKLKDGWFYVPVEEVKNLAIPRVVFLFLKDIFELGLA
jgi:A/G-specific adenine glycosylase